MDDPMARTALGALAGSYWETFLETHPLFATALGDPRFDDRLADPTPAGIAAARGRFAELLADVDALGDAALDDEDRVTRDALREALSSDMPGSSGSPSRGDGPGWVRRAICWASSAKWY